MRCSDIEELLSAYANGELSRTQREFVEEHIADCPTCRAKLEEYTNIRRQLASLREMPVLQDIKAATMSEIKEVDIRRSVRKWLRPALAAITAVAILATLITWQPWSSTPSSQSVMVKAQAAIAGLQSYRISLVATSDMNNEETSTVKGEYEFVAPDRYHVKQSGDIEYIFIGDKKYFKNSPPSVGATMMVSLYGSMLTREYTNVMLSYLTDVEELPDETVDGAVCLHYRGTLDYEKRLAELSGDQSLSDEAREKMMEEIRSIPFSTVIELWMGKDDYLIRRMKRTDSADNGEAGMEMRFYDFNQPIVIEAPLDSNGELLPGWTSTSPEFPHLSADIQADVNNYNPSDRRVNYAINITNISEETLENVDVDIVNGFAGITAVGDIWFSWENGQWTRGPYTLDPGESLEYSCTFGYDATSVQPETVAETIEKSYIEVRYPAPDGQQKSEVFRFEVPDSIYTLSTDVPPSLVPVEITVSGEYRLEEPGATYTGNGAVGVIDGKEYLFVEVNTAGAEVPASPGILVLDISNKTSPGKVAFLSTNDDTRYIRGATLYGTVLYVSIDDSLWVIDVSDPAAPRELSRLPGLSTNHIIVSGKYAFINDGNHDIVTLDLSAPAHPEIIGNLPLSSITSIQLDIYGDYLIAEANDVLYVIDTSMPSSLEIVSEHSFRGAIDDSTPWIEYPLHIMGTEIEDECAYVVLSAEGKVAIGVLDLSQPASPGEIAFFRLKDRYFHGPMFVSGERAYIFTMKSSGGDLRTRLEIIDISHPAEPAEIGFGIMPDCLSFFTYSYSSSNTGYSLIDNYLYWFIGNSPNQPVIEVIDLSGL